MHYIYCVSYEPLFFALYLKSLGEKITVVTHNKNIAKYCEVKNINYIQFENIRINVTSIHKIFTFKKILDNVLKKIVLEKGDIFYLTGEIKTYNAFYLAKELSKKGVVYFYNSGKYRLEKYKPPKNKPFFFRGGIIRLMLKLYLDLDLIYYNSRGVPCFGIDDGFLKKHNIVKYDTDISAGEMLLNIAKRSGNNYEKIDNLIIDQGALENIVDLESVKKLYKNLFKLPVEFAFKKHPRSVTQMKQPELLFYEIFKSCDELPEYIPVELFYNNIKKNVLSIYSTSLVVASQFDHLKAISLLELVNWDNNSFKEEVKCHLTEKSNNKIFFPNSFDELKDIINEPRKR